MTTVATLALASMGFFVAAKWQFRLEYQPLVDVLAHPGESLFVPGMRLPLGVVGCIAVVVTAGPLLGAPWRAIGDAVAVGASALVAVGRFGCFINGCCSGALCPAWETPLCVRYSFGTEPYALQRSAGLIDEGALLSLPVHPLPLYFGAAAAATLFVLLLLLRRGAPPGVLLAVFCILEPLSKLALEPLRASTRGRPTGLMLAVPATLLIATCVILTIAVARKRLWS